MKVYFIAGIGTDHRIFNHIQLPDGFEIQHIGWLVPGESESIADYAGRLAESIDCAEPFILIGLSLGGILATEIAATHAPRATILISSIPRAADLPPYYYTAKKLKLHKLVPAGLIRASATVKHALVKQEPHDRKMIFQMIREADPYFVRWAMNAVLEWENKTCPEPFWHIHGSRDEVFPIRYTNPTHVIQKASHSLVTTHWQELNEMLNTILLQAINQAGLPVK